MLTQTYSFWNTFTRLAHNHKRITILNYKTVNNRRKCLKFRSLAKLRILEHPFSVQNIPLYIFMICERQFRTNIYSQIIQLQPSPINSHTWGLIINPSYHHLEITQLLRIHPPFPHTKTYTRLFN